LSVLISEFPWHCGCPFCFMIPQNFKYLRSIVNGNNSIEEEIKERKFQYVHVVFL
jgi:hypothetical protein